MARHDPPRAARRLLQMLLKGDARDTILGDLDEEFSTDILPAEGRRAARRWYWAQALHTITDRARLRITPHRPARAGAGSLMPGLWQDLRFAARSFGKHPGFAAVAVVTLALGIGANTAIFSVVDAVMLRDLPYGDPDRLVLLWNTSSTAGTQHMPIAAPDVADYRDQAGSFVGFAFTDRVRDAALTGDGEPQHVTVARVSSNLFSVLGVPAHAGRTFVSGEGLIPRAISGDTADAVPPNVVMLSYGLWTRRFGQSPGVIGRTIEISGEPNTVVGILPADFALWLPPNAGFARHVDVWSPLRFSLADFQRRTRLRDRDSDNTGAVVARLRDGVTLEQAQQEMHAIAARHRESLAFHAVAGLEIQVVPMHDDVIGHARPVLVSLLGAVTFVLLIACINVANLLLARGTDRRGELALRAALGANRGRLLRQAMAESLLLAAAGSLAGLVLAQWSVTSLVAWAPANLPRIDTIGMDGTVLAFTLASTLVATVIFGTAPAIDAATRRGRELVQPRNSGARRRTRVRSALVASEVALTLVLLVGAGLMLQSLARLQRVQPGFEADGVMAFDLTLSYPNEYRGPAARSAFVGQLEQRLGELPGVAAVGLIGRIPLGGRQWTQPYGLDGQSETEWNANEANFRVITKDYFAAMGTRLLAGRYFVDADDRQDIRVAVVDETMARRIAPGGGAVGARIGFPLDGQAVWAEVVGVVEDVRHDDLRVRSRESLYVPYRHEASREVSFVVRTTAEPAALVGPIRRALRVLAPHLPMYNVQTMNDYVADALGPTRFALRLIGVFALLAVVLASVGLYGVISYAVRQRTHEIGIRMALGARPESVRMQVVADGMTLAGVGIVVGVGVSVFTSRWLGSLLFNVSPADGWTYVGVSLLLSGVALLACYVPARRASGVDPMRSLR
jgi:putative ABC transport system permease protein